MANDPPKGVVLQFLRRFFGSIGLMFIPLPISIFRGQLAGRSSEGGDLVFYTHPNFVCTMHLIWVGWLVTIGAFVRDYFDPEGASQLWNALLSWPWLVVLTLTIIVMGLHFARVAVGFLIAGTVIFGLGIWLIQSLSDYQLFKQIWDGLARIPVFVRWGVPMVVSVVLGFTFVCVATWRRMNDCWTLKPTGNYLEHENFQERDRTISKGAKTFVAVFPCLLRRYLFFGFGDIEVRSSTGTTVIDRIDGVFFAKRHADIIKYRFGTTDIVIHPAEVGAESEDSEDEEAGDEAL